jgi:hypothetical protein
MRYIELYVGGQRVTEWSKWETAELNVTRDAERFSIEASIDNVVLLDQAYQAVDAAFRNGQYKPVRVRLKLGGGLTWEGLIEASRAKWGRNRMVVSITIDELALFERAVMGRRPSTIASVEVALEREADYATVAALLAAAMLLLYTIIKESSDLARDIANAVAHAAGGATGPIAAAIFQAVVFAIRALFIAALAAAFIEVLDQLIALLPTRKPTKAINLYDAITDVTQAAGYTASLPSELKKIWLIGDYVDTLEATELIGLARRILNAQIYMANGTLRFASLYRPFPLHNVAYTEFYRMNTDDFTGRTIIGLLRDFTDRFSSGLPHNVEIAYSGFMGLDRQTIEYAPAKVKTQPSKLDGLASFLNRILGAARRIVRSVRVPDPMPPGNIIVGSDYFEAKIIMAEGLTGLDAGAETALHRFIADRYQKKLAEVYESVRIPFTENDYTSLAQQGFPGVRRLRWAINSDYAEVDYEMPTTLQPQKTTYIL